MCGLINLPVTLVISILPLIIQQPYRDYFLMVSYDYIPLNHQY